MDQIKKEKKRLRKSNKPSDFSITFGHWLTMKNASNCFNLRNWKFEKVHKNYFWASNIFFIIKFLKKIYFIIFKKIYSFESFQNYCSDSLNFNIYSCDKVSSSVCEHFYIFRIHCCKVSYYLNLKIRILIGVSSKLQTFSSWLLNLTYISMFY